MKTILIFFLVFLSCTIEAQQHHNFTQYSLNRFALNPAVAGMRACNNLFVGNRSQWIGFDGAPENLFASLYTRINKEERFPERVHGVGLYISKEKEGIQNTIYTKIAYSYHLNLWKNYKASIGVFLGVQQKTVGSNFNRPAGYQVDPAFEDNGPEYIFPEISPAFYIEGKQMFAGISLFQAFPTKLKKIGTGKTNLAPHLYLMGGYHFRDSKFTYSPSFLLSIASLNTPTLDVTFTIDYKNILSLGIGSKYVNSGYFTVALQALHWLKIGYAYEYAFSQINKIAPNTHEITLNITGCESYIQKLKPKIFCPVYK